MRKTTLNQFAYWIRQQFLLTVLVAISFGTATLKAQIYQPEGLNMPGAWNGWTNPPTNNLALASFTQVPGGMVTKISTGITRWQTTFSAAATGGNVVGGTHGWLFTSGPTGSPWNNKWGSVTVAMNTLQNYTKEGANNSITVVNGKWYTMNWKDNGYTNTQAIFMETSALPVDITNVTVPVNVAPNTAATVNITTSVAPCAEELFYILYSTNNFITSQLALVTMVGNTGTASIPGQLPGTLTKYYVFSTTANSPSANYDLYSIKINNNSGNYYSYTTNGLNTEAEILTFSFAEQTAPATINSLAASISIEVAFGSNLTALVPTITVSNGASIDPASGVAQDFTNPVSYLVTAQDGINTKLWSVTVTVAPPPDPNYGLRDDGGTLLPTFTYWYTGQAGDITEQGSIFNGKDLGTLTSFNIKGASFNTWKTGTGDVTGAQFKYKVWAISETEPVDYTLRTIGWTSNLGSGNQIWAGFGDFIPIAQSLTPGAYNIKIYFTITGTGVPGLTADGPFIGTFTVSSGLSNEAEILTFTLPEQTSPATFNNAAATVDIEVAYGTNVTTLTPTITISNGASITPQSGIIQDFTNPVVYTVTAEDDATTKIWTVTVTQAAPPSITWANLQWPGSGTIEPNQQFYVYAQAYANGITPGAGQGTGLQAWIGYSTENSNPNTWTTWIEAPYFGESSDNDEFRLDLGALMSTTGTFYYASRFKLSGQDFVYGGFSGGFWDGTTNVSGVLTVNTPPVPEITWANVQWPGSGTIDPNQEFFVYAQAFANGITPNIGQGVGLQAWIGYSTENTNPDTWTSWVEAPYLGESGSNDEFRLDLGALMNTSGTYYYASRFKLNDQPYVYGGYSGGFWDGITNINGVLTVNSTTKTLNIKVFLEGLYAGSMTMNKAQDELGDHFPGTVADQITVELHNGTDYATIEYSQANVDLNQDGTASITIPSTYNGSYWLTIKHRNSIETVSADLIDLSVNTITYDFSTVASLTFGDNIKDLGEGVYGLFVGDANQDGLIDGDDLVFMDPDIMAGNVGFLSSDLNGDGLIDGDDLVKGDANFTAGVALVTP